MKLFTYGDSWTEGQGVNPTKEDSIDSREERKYFRNSKSWPKVLSDLLGLEHQNQSLSGANNNHIFNSVINDIKSGIVNSGDLIIIMWSSSLRDDVPFFPVKEWHTWGTDYLKDNFKSKWFISKDLTKNSTYNDFLTNFKEFFINELYTQDYYNIINQNYILFLQKLFEFYHINYVMCDAFDKMIIDVKIENDRTHLINNKPYWGFRKKTFRDYLILKDNRRVWENFRNDITKLPGMHPSELGYKLISNEIFEFINQNKSDIIRYDEDKKIKIL